MGGQDFDLANVYLPPVSSCPSGYVPDLTRLPDALGSSQRCLVVGDFNAHDPSWLYTQGQDARGRLLLDQLEGLTTLNDPSLPTRLPFTTSSLPSSPDISFSSPSAGLGARWAVHHELSSDHLPIVVEVPISTPIPPNPPRSFLNIRKANWPAYTAQLERELGSFDPSTFPTLHAAVRVFNSAVMAASRRHIPAGRVRRYVPLFSREVKLLLRERRHLRSQRPTRDTLERAKALSEEISRRFQADAELRWSETLASVDHRTSPSKFWKLVRSLHSRFVGDPDTHEAILASPSSPIPSPRGQADLLVDHYASICRLPIFLRIAL